MRTRFRAANWFPDVERRISESMRDLRFAPNPGRTARAVTPRHNTRLFLLSFSWNPHDIVGSGHLPAFGIARDHANHVGAALDVEIALQCKGRGCADARRFRLLRDLNIDRCYDRGGLPSYSFPQRRRR